jgi:DNA-binding Xre family transcriptional regulator
MIVFDKLWVTMEKRGINKYKLREKHSIDPRTIKRLMDNDNVETKTLDKLCAILDCNIEDIMTYIKEPPSQ